MIDDWWADSVKQIYREALAALGGEDALLATFGDDDTPLESGPGHLAWADGNFEDEHIQFCLDSCEKRRDEWIERWGEAALSIARLALERLMAIPEDERGEDPNCYDPDDEPGHYVKLTATEYRWVRDEEAK